MNAEAKPVSQGDRVTYLHHTDDLGQLRGHAAMADAEVRLTRWTDKTLPNSRAQLGITIGSAGIHLHLPADDLRTLAYALLLCASDLDDAAAPTARTPDARARADSLPLGIEHRPWPMPSGAA